MDIQYLYSKEQKLKWYGDGEWLDEPDLVKFIYNGIKCEVIRMNSFQLSGKSFGGHFCGYCTIPFGHVLFTSNNYSSIDSPINEFEVHGGITYDRTEEDESRKIGFDCAHHMDIVPSMELMNATIPEIIEIQKLYPTPDFMKKSYKNIEFVINECKNLAIQINNYKECHDKPD